MEKVTLIFRAWCAFSIRITLFKFNEIYFYHLQYSTKFSGPELRLRVMNSSIISVVLMNSLKQFMSPLF